MDRKEFLDRSCRCGLGAAAFALLGSGAPLCAGTKADGPEDQDAAFRSRWILGLLANLEAQLDAPSRVRFMEGCGRSCARAGAVKAALAAKGDVEALLKTLRSWIGPDNVRRQGPEIHLVFERCLCPMVAKGPERLPDLYCNCSRGWVLEMFETAGGQPVKVDLLDSIKRGGKRCHMVVKAV